MRLMTMSSLSALQYSLVCFYGLHCCTNPKKMMNVLNSRSCYQNCIHALNPIDPLFVTPRKINMEPENRPLEKENHLPNHHFQVLC